MTDSLLGLQEAEQHAWHVHDLVRPAGMLRVQHLKLFKTCPLISHFPLYRSSGNRSSSSYHWGNNVQGGDRRNNVERVVVNRPAAGAYSITVTPAYLFVRARPQYYSLVVLGAINSTLDSPYNPAYARFGG
jgi:hypothetical protein